MRGQSAVASRSHLYPSPVPALGGLLNATPTRVREHLFRAWGDSGTGGLELERSARASSVRSRRLSRTTQETERKQINKHYFPSKRRKQAGAARSRSLRRRRRLSQPRLDQDPAPGSWPPFLAPARPLAGSIASVLAPLPLALCIPATNRHLCCRHPLPRASFFSQAVPQKETDILTGAEIWLLCPYPPHILGSFPDIGASQALAQRPNSCACIHTTAPGEQASPQHLHAPAGAAPHH